MLQMKTLSLGQEPFMVSFPIEYLKTLTVHSLLRKVLFSLGNLIKLGRDKEGKIIYQCTRTKLITIGPKELHVLMCKPVKDGGYKDAYDKNGDVKFSLTTLETYWPVHLKKMSKNDMNMCACAICQNMDGLHGSNVAKRRRLSPSLN